MTFVGFDLQKRYSTARALDASGEIITDMRQLSTALEAVVAAAVTSAVSPGSGTPKLSMPMRLLLERRRRTVTEHNVTERSRRER